MVRLVCIKYSVHMRALRARLGNAEGSNTRKQKTESRCVVVKRLSSRAGTRAIRRERLSGRQANWGRGKNVSSARSAPKHSAKSFSPVPLHHEWAGEADEGQLKRHPARERPLPAGQKSRSGGTRPPSPRMGGEADEGQPKRRGAAGAESVTQYAQAHNVRVSGI